MTATPVLTLTNYYQSRKKVIMKALVSTLLLALLALLAQTYCYSQTETVNQRNKYLDESITYSEYNPSIEILPESEAPIAPLSQGLCILIRIFEQDAWLYKDEDPINSTRVTTGKLGKETPTGFFYVVNKHKDWISTIYHRDMPFFLRLNPGDFGLHQGVLSNKPASNGCIRLPASKAKEFFEQTPIGTPVFIIP